MESDLTRDGVVVLPSVLTAREASETLRRVSAELEARRRDVGAGESALRHFQPVLEPRGRYDLKLSLEDAQVRRSALRVAAGIAPRVASLLGADAELTELGAIVSDPGAAAQPTHPDTPWSEQPVLLTAFVALQRVARSMGPTRFYPGTHTSAAHAAFQDSRPGGARERLLERSRCWAPLLRSGDATLYDSRLLHCGGANESAARRRVLRLRLPAVGAHSAGRRRALFYLSFRARAAESPQCAAAFGGGGGAPADGSAGQSEAAEERRRRGLGTTLSELLQRAP